MNRSVMRIAGLCGIIALIPACVSDSWRVEVAGKEVLHHNWWNYYERGRALLLEGNVAEAAADFEASLGLRPGAKFGYPRDLWRARTYGLHFVEAYFPNRELGVAYYLSGRIPEAIRHLEVSLRQEPSGRAKYYLNAARAKSLAGKTVRAPSVMVEPDCKTLWTRDDRRRVDGVVYGDGYIRSVSVNGRPLFIELASRSIALAEIVRLAPGTNQVVVTARDLAGQEVSERLSWVLDRQPPRFTISEIRKEAGAWLVRGTCVDDYGIANVTVSGTPCLAPGDDGRTTVPVTVRVPAGTLARFVAVDLAGNRLETPLALEPAAAAGRCGAASGLLAWNGDGVLDGGGLPLQLALSEGPAAEDRLKPTLRLGGARPVTEVFQEQFFVDGEASDAGGLAAIRLNGENLLPAGSRGAVRSYFSRRLDLEVGTNVFEIVAEDVAGNRAAQSLTVVRGEPEYLGDEYRLSVGVPPLRPAEDAQTCERVKRKMEEELLRDPVRFHLLERDEGWDFILREQKLSLSDLADPKAALQIGKMLPAEVLLMGTVMREGGGVTVYVKGVETGNGRVVISDDVYSETAEENLEYQVEGLVMKIEQRFPLVSGAVLAVAGDSATISVGSREGVAGGTRFVVIGRADGGDIRSGKVRKVDGEFVQLDVKRAGPNSGTAAILPGAGKDAVKEGDYVYAR